MIYIKVKRVVVRILRPCWQQTIGLATGDFLAIFEYFGGDFFWRFLNMLVAKFGNSDMLKKIKKYHKS